MIPPMSPLSNGPDTYSPVANSQYQRSPPMHPLQSGSPIGANQYLYQSPQAPNTQTETSISSTTPQIPSSPTTQFQPSSSIQSSIFSPPQQGQGQSQYLSVQQSPNSPPLNSQSQLYGYLPPLPPSPASPTSLTFPSPTLSSSSPANAPIPAPPSTISETTRTALNTYVPCLPDEIHVQSGNQVAIEFIYEDGWASGVNLATGETGVFPLSCFVGMDNDTDSAKTEGRDGFDQHERLARTVSLNRNLGA
ncbi:hypothetical protein BKA69DRAFT_1067530 [Paraphysoderma sedebokerense]|nr:hypothetical protein BKA69DRAFT_1067530 [Paraphysoderma sedebokerense]